MELINGITSWDYFMGYHGINSWDESMGQINGINMRLLWDYLWDLCWIYPTRILISRLQSRIINRGLLGVVLEHNGYNGVFFWRKIVVTNGGVSIAMFSGVRSYLLSSKPA